MLRTWAAFFLAILAARLPARSLLASVSSARRKARRAEHSAAHVKGACVQFDAAASSPPPQSQKPDQSEEINRRHPTSPWLSFCWRAVPAMQSRVALHDSQPGTGLHSSRQVKAARPSLPQSTSFSVRPFPQSQYPARLPSTGWRQLKSRASSWAPSGSQSFDARHATQSAPVELGEPGSCSEGHTGSRLSLPAATANVRRGD
mmetsp:Transcript_74334/g.145204  ORF Transcript_74334/g.145204 Transcript_74334/m.145204 type:complete len:203 (+) Transcript_74334:82-690(+)